MPDLIVALGSHHGDDKIGWLVAERLRTRLGDPARIRLAAAPLHLLDWLDGDIESLCVIDACLGSAEPGRLHWWTWPRLDGIVASRSTGSHDLSLAHALALADQLGRLPTNTRVCGIELCDRGASDDAPPELNLDRIAVQILVEVQGRASARR